MGTKRKTHSTEPLDIPQMPFDEALRRALNAPPKHKIKKKRRQKSKAY